MDNEEYYIRYEGMSISEFMFKYQFLNGIIGIQHPETKRLWAIVESIEVDLSSCHVALNMIRINNPEMLTALNPSKHMYRFNKSSFLAP